MLTPVKVIIESDTNVFNWRTEHVPSLVEYGQQILAQDHVSLIQDMKQRAINMANRWENGDRKTISSLGPDFQVLFREP